MKSNSILELYQLAETIWFPSYRHSHAEDKLKFLFGKMYNQKEMKEQIESKTKLFYFIESEEKKKIGYFALEPSDEIVKLDKIYVDQSFQKRGVGSEVMVFIKDFAKQNNFRAIILNVNRENKNAIGFYKRHQFRITESLDIDAGNGFVFDDYVMQFDLQNE